MKRYFCTLAMLLLACTTLSARANVVIGGTRVVFPADSGEVTIRLENQGKRPSLIQAWIDRGNATATPDTADAPFLITPPIFRIDPRKAQSLRIIYTHEALPVDRESLFWLNVLEIPPKPTAAEAGDKNYLQLAVRSRLKLFFRPPGMGDPLKAPQRVTWKAVRDANGWALELHNPTPYHITFSKVGLSVDGKHWAVDTGMVSPMADLRLPIKGLEKAPANGSPVIYQIINDYGSATSFKGTLAP